MKVYVAGPVADAAVVRQVQSKVVAAGHKLTLDWTEDLSFAENYASRQEVSARSTRPTHTHDRTVAHKHQLTMAHRTRPTAECRTGTSRLGDS